MGKLVSIDIDSPYGGKLPPRLAKLASDAAQALNGAQEDFKSKNALFRLTDAYRDSAEQARAHNDWKTGRKKAYSPPAGSSMHEAGRAIDVDLAVLIHPDSVPTGYTLMDEGEARKVLKARGWIPIADQGNPHTVDVKESWHFEFRGEFQNVYDAQMELTGSRKKAYTAMAKAAIADLKTTGAFDAIAKANSKTVAAVIPEPAKPEAENAKDTASVTSTTETPSGTVTEKKEIQMTQASPTAKKLTVGAIVMSALGFIQQAWQTSQEATISGFQYLMKHMPMVVLILGVLLFAYWIWNKDQQRRAERLKLVVDTNADPNKSDVVIT